MLLFFTEEGMSLKDRLNDLAEAVRKSNEELRRTVKDTGVKGAVAKSFSEIGFVKNRADRVINQLNQSQWVAGHEPGYFDAGLAHKLQETKAILERSSLLDGFDNIVPVGKLRNWIDKLAASSASYAAIRSFQKREQVKTKLFEFSKRIEEQKANKEFKKSQKTFNEENQRLFEDLIELREGRRIQEGALKMQGPLALRKDEREKIERAIQDRTIAETLASAQLSARLEVRETETDLSNKKIAAISKLSDKIEASKRQYLDKQGYMTYLFNRTFKLADGFSAEVDKNGIVIVFNAEGNAILPNDPVLDPENPGGVIQVDESSKGDMFASSIAKFEEFSTENIGLTPKSMASRYSRAMKAKIREAIAEGKSDGYLTGEVARARMAYVNGLLETLDKQADKEHYKKTREYQEYQASVSRIKAASDAERFNMYERVIADYEAILGNEAFAEFAERVAKLPEKNARAKAYSELKREIVEGLPGSVLSIGKNTLDQMMESISEIQAKQREITDKYVEPFLGAMYLSQGPLASVPAKSPDGGYVVFDPESKAGKENNGCKVVATFEEAKKYYSFLESPEDLGEFLANPDFRDNSSTKDMTEEEFLRAIENHQLIPTRIAEYKQTYDSFVAQTVGLEYARDKAIDEVQRGVASGEVKLNDETRAFLAPNDEGKQTWFIEENGETRELLENAELLSLETLEEESINGFIETKLMPIKLRELDKLSFNKKNELVNENGEAVFDGEDLERIQERIDAAHERYQQNYIDNVIESTRAPMSPSGPSPTGPAPATPGGPAPATPGGPTGPTTTGPSGPTPTGPAPGTPGSPSPSGPAAPGADGEIKYKVKPYKVGDVNVAGIIKFLQVKKCMSYDLIAESAARLALQYKRLAKKVPAPVYSGTYTIKGAGPSAPAPTGPAPVPTGPSSAPTEAAPAPTAPEAGKEGAEGTEPAPVEEETKTPENPQEGAEQAEEPEKEGEEAEQEGAEGTKPAPVEGEKETPTEGEAEAPENAEEDLDKIGREIDEEEKAKKEAEEATRDAVAGEEKLEKKYKTMVKKEAELEAATKAKEAKVAEYEKFKATLKNPRFVEPATKETVEQAQGRNLTIKHTTTIETGGERVVVDSEVEINGNDQAIDMSDFAGMSAEQLATIERLQKEIYEAEAKEARAKNLYERAERAAEKALDEGAMLENIAEEKQNAVKELENNAPESGTAAGDVIINFDDAEPAVQEPAGAQSEMTEEQKLQARIAEELNGVVMQAEGAETLAPAAGEQAPVQDLPNVQDGFGLEK